MGDQECVFLAVMLVIGSCGSAGLRTDVLRRTSRSAHNQIEEVEIYLFDLARTTLGCSYRQCFRLDIVINGVRRAHRRLPGDPLNMVDFPAKTPYYDGRSLDKTALWARTTSWRGDSMPYAIFILDENGRTTGFAIHAGHNRVKESRLRTSTVEIRASSKRLGGSALETAFARIWSNTRIKCGYLDA